MEGSAAMISMFFFLQLGATMNTRVGFSLLCITLAFALAVAQAQEPAPVSMTADALIAAVVKDHDAFNKAYPNDKHMVLTGKIREVLGDPPSSIQLVGVDQKDSDDKTINCSVPADATAIVAKLKKGQIVKITGAFNGSQVFDGTWLINYLSRTIEVVPAAK
jgi:hypothetical protein